MVVVASPGYWVTHGQPLAPEDLIQHQCLTYSLGKGGGVHPEWRFQRNGKAVDVGRASMRRTRATASITVLRTGGPGRALPARAASQRGSGPPRAGAGAAGIRTHRHLAVHGLCPAPGTTALHCAPCWIFWHPGSHHPLIDQPTPSITCCTLTKRPPLHAGLSCPPSQRCIWCSTAKVKSGADAPGKPTRSAPRRTLSVVRAGTVM